MLLRCLVAVLGGLLLAAAFEPVGLAVLLPVGVAAWLGSLRGLAPSRAWLPSLVFGISFIFAVMVWMRAVGTDAWLAMCAIEAAFFAPLGSLAAAATRGRWWPWWTAVAWTGVEYLRSVWPFSGMPFGRLAFATADTPWSAALPWVGMTGVSLVVALTGTGLVWAALRVRERPARVIAVAVGSAAALLAVGLLPSTTSVTGRISVAVVQGNVPGSGTDVVAVHPEVTRNHVERTLDLAQEIQDGAAARPDLVVWPENSTAVDPFSDGVRQQISSAVDAVGAPVLVGAMVDGPTPEHVLNQGIVWRPGIGGGDRYTKRHPVPYGEYVPFRGEPWMPSTYGRLREIPRDMMSGARTTPLRTGTAAVAGAICFDIAYDDTLPDQLANGADLVTVQTSNAMFVDTGQIDQQFEITRLRAIETGRWVAVAAINGVSGVVSPDGVAVATVGAREAGTLVEEVELREGRTPAVVLGAAAGWAAFGAAVLHASWCWFAYRLTSRRVSARPAPTSPEGD